LMPVFVATEYSIIQSLKSVLEYTYEYNP